MKDYSYEILDLLKKYDGNTEAALAGENSPQCLYAFSPLRENLFEWVEFEKDAKVLQIGSDYGSYTGILAKRAGQVVVLDGRDENLEVNRLRHGHRENIRYVSGDILTAAGDGAAVSKAAADWKAYRPENAPEALSEILTSDFDYVVLTLGSVEKEQAAAVLYAAAGFLKKGGTLLAAAENETGVRYWMGGTAMETTFLQVEFLELFKSLEETYPGSLTMYYPTPDYRYPVTIYSDAYLPAPGDLNNISARYDGPGVRFGSEEEAMAKACRNGEFSKLANSFLGAWKKK